MSTSMLRAAQDLGHCIERRSDVRAWVHSTPYYKPDLPQACAALLPAVREGSVQLHPEVGCVALYVDGCSGEFTSENVLRRLQWFREVDVQVLALHSLQTDRGLYHVFLLRVHPEILRRAVGITHDPLSIVSDKFDLAIDRVAPQTRRARVVPVTAEPPVAATPSRRAGTADATAPLQVVMCCLLSLALEHVLCHLVRNARKNPSSAVFCHLCGDAVPHWPTLAIAGWDESVAGYVSGGEACDTLLLSSCGSFVLMPLGLPGASFAWVCRDNVCFTVGTADLAAFDNVNDEDECALRHTRKNAISSLLL